MARSPFKRYPFGIERSFPVLPVLHCSRPVDGRLILYTSANGTKVHLPDSKYFNEDYLASG
jgi:hypothetical protein